MFDIAQLQKNQRDYIESHKADLDHWSCDLPKDIPIDVGDKSIEEIFSRLNLNEPAGVRFVSMKGPVDTIGPEGQNVPVVSRPGKMRANWFSPSFSTDYFDDVMHEVTTTVAIMRENFPNKQYVFYFGMWIPVYAAYAAKDVFRGGIMYHAGRKPFEIGESK